MPLSPFIKRRRQQKRKRNLDRERVINGRNPLKSIEATVRKADEEKVENCTEDVDALLVFAGLYSAVLTAFLIESYKNLSADESESLLRQIAFQTANYSFNNGHLNTTFDPSQLPAFHAAVSDIRVNVCWFASLILSLSSASFGIAVKQWLREYLSIDCIDPLERLRIRHARFQGLQDWKLFQIAAFLPILLQISLALFFVGLCFFTAAVHRSIEITSLLLVSCWAFFFFMSVIAPLFSPRCPYKTTLLKVPFRYSRPYVQSFLRRVHVFQRSVQVLFDALRNVFLVFSVGTSHKDIVKRSRTIRRRRVGKIKWREDYMDLGMIHELSSGVFCKDLVRGEEDMLRSADDNDIVIFCDVDGVFLDDNLLDSMRRTLGERLHPLADALRFVTAIIQRRSGFTLAEAASGKIDQRQPWPWTLSRYLRTALVDMLVASMEYELSHESSSIVWWDHLTDSEWSGSFAVLALLVPPQDAMPSSVTRLFELLHEYRSKHDNEYNPLDVFSYQMKALALSDHDWPARSLLFLAQALSTLKPEEAEQCLRYVVYKSFLEWGSSEDTYCCLLERDPDEVDADLIAPTPQRIVALLEVARVILHKYTHEQTHVLDEFPAGISLLLAFVFDVMPRVKNSRDINLYEALTGALEEPGLGCVLVGLFTTPNTTQALLYFFAAHSRLLPPPQSDQFFLLFWIHAHHYVTQDTAIAVLNACTEFFESDPILDSPAVLLRPCVLIYHYFDTRENEDIEVCWRQLFTAVHARYERILDESNDKSQFGISKLTCADSVSDERHTDACETAYTILHRCNFPGCYRRAPSEMVTFLCKLMCGSRNASNLICFPGLDNTENQQAEATALDRSHNSPGGEQETVPPDAKSNQLISSDNTPTVHAPADSPDDQCSDKRHASARGDTVSSGLPAADDPAPGDAATTLCTPTKDLADSGSGRHDEGRAAESSQCADLARAQDREPQDLIGIAVIEGSVHEPCSMRLEENATSEPLESAENVPMSVLPGNTQGINATPSLNILPTDPRANPAAMTSEHPPSPPLPALAMPAPLSNDCEAPRDIPSANGERGTVIPPDSRPMTFAGHGDAPAVLDAVEREDTVGDVAGPSRERPGLLVALESRGILSPPLAAPEMRCSVDADNEMDDDGGDLPVLDAT